MNIRMVFFLSSIFALGNSTHGMDDYSRALTTIVKGIKTHRMGFLPSYGVFKDSQFEKKCLRAMVKVGKESFPNKHKEPTSARNIDYSYGWNYERQYSC